MNSRTSPEEHEPGMSFEEKIDILFHEIDLAMKWSRPSILFAVYNSGSILSKAKAELEDRLSNLRQKTRIIEISGKKQTNFSTEIFRLPQLNRSVLFIDDINCRCCEGNSGFFKELKWNLEKFIDHQIKVVFWLANEDVPHFATNAIECWILRHHVVEFQDSPYQTNALLQTLESAWQDVDENDLDNPASAAAIQEILHAPEDVEPNFFHGNLILMLGVLYWRKGNSVDAERFLNAALGISQVISHQKLEDQCKNALQLVRSDPRNTDDATIAARQATPESSEPEHSLVETEQPAGTPPEAAVDDTGKEIKVIVQREQERGEDMKESEQVFDHKTSSEWNELGNKFLRSGSYNDAINAFTKAIELAPDVSWPYIKNLAAAHYHKGKVKGKSSSGKTEEPDVWEGEEEEEQVAYFDQDDLPPAQRGDAVEPEGGLLPVSPQTSAADNVTSPSKAEPFAPQEKIPVVVDSSPVVEPSAGDPVVGQLDQLVAANSDLPAFPSRVQGVDSGPQSPYEWNQLGNSFTNSRKFAQAIGAYKKSIELDPRFGQPYSNLGSVLYQIGKYQSAVILLQKSLEYLDSPEEIALSWNRLGDVYRRMRDYGNALAAYQKASQLSPDTNPVLMRARLSLMDSVAVG
jgi:tetratricopeptide (TPR) repeat protein